jgi:LysM repeat protein
MNSLRQLSAGILTAIGSSLLVLAAISLALLEGQIGAASPIQVSPTAVLEETAAAPVEGVSVPGTPGGVASPTIPPVAPTAPGTGCPAAPAGWSPYTIQSGDTLESLAALAGVTTAEIIKVNCLIVTGLRPGITLNLPIVAPTNTVPPALPTAPPTTGSTAIPTTVSTAIPCGPPSGWVRYTVQRNDNLFRLSQALGVSVWQLQNANCLNGITIYAGQPLWVPFIPVQVPTETVTPTPTLPPSDTPVIVPTTEEPSSTSTPTDTPTTTPTITPTDTPTETPEPSTTPTPTQTDTVTPPPG